VLVTVSQPVEEAVDAIRAAWDRGEPVAPVPPGEEERSAAALRLDEEVHPDVAAIVTTSGTTGEPRAVELTWSGLRAVAAALPGEPDDRWLLALPLHHVAGLAVVARAWAQGLPVVFDGAATHVSLVPTQVRRLLAAGDDLSRFRTVLVGGGPVPADVRAVPNVVATYGMTETWGGIVHDGRPLHGVEVFLADDAEILVRTPTIMRGYRGDPAATASVFTTDGWFRTGDAGRWAPDGRLEVVDRLRDLVITGGVNVSPTEVERVLARHPAVADVCVAGVPDEDWGERVVAYVVPSVGCGPPPTVDELRSFARPHLAAAKLPKDVVVVDAIPRTPGGKPLRRLLTGTLPQEST
jgi:O-succinylbenzoic acid--CoA ligase